MCAELPGTLSSNVSAHTTNKHAHRAAWDREYARDFRILTRCKHRFVIAVSDTQDMIDKDWDLLKVHFEEEEDRKRTSGGEKQRKRGGREDERGGGGNERAVLPCDRA